MFCSGRQFALFLISSCTGSAVTYTDKLSVQGLAKRRVPGLVNFDTAVAHRHCLGLTAAFTEPRVHLLAEPCSQTSACLDLRLGREAYY